MTTSATRPAPRVWDAEQRSRIDDIFDSLCLSVDDPDFAEQCSIHDEIPALFLSSDEAGENARADELRQLFDQFVDLCTQIELIEYALREAEATSARAGEVRKHLRRVLAGLEAGVGPGMDHAIHTYLFRHRTTENQG